MRTQLLNARKIAHFDENRQNDRFSRTIFRLMWIKQYLGSSKKYSKD